MALEQTAGAVEASSVESDELTKALSLIFELAKEAKAGDESAKLGLDYLKNVQLARNENLRREAELIQTRIFITALTNSAASIAAMR